MTTCRSGGLGAGEAAGAGTWVAEAEGCRFPCSLLSAFPCPWFASCPVFPRKLLAFQSFFANGVEVLGRFPSVAPQMSGWRAELGLTLCPRRRVPSWYLELPDCGEETAVLTFQRRAIVGQLLYAG